MEPEASKLKTFEPSHKYKILMIIDETEPAIVMIPAIFGKDLRLYARFFKYNGLAQ